MNARDFGIPQNRERVFCISEYQGEKDYKFTSYHKELLFKMYDVLEKDVASSYYLKHGQVLDAPIIQDVSYCLDSNYWKGVTLNSFLTKHRRQVVTDGINSEGKHMVRRLTPKETWKLMGVSDEDYEKASQLISNTSLYKQSGNSIVVNVLEAVFTEVFL